MADIKPIKPIRLCINITIPTIDDDSISLYEAVGVLGTKLQEAIQKINESFGSLEGAYTPQNPPPYPVTSVNGQTGKVVISIPENAYTEDNPPPYPVTSVNRAETKDVITVFEPEGGDIGDVTQSELITACKAGARLGAFNQDNGTCRLYHFNLYANPERVEYSEVAGGGASGVTSVNGQTGAVNIFNAPINAATTESVTALQTATTEQLNQLKDNISDAWQSGKTYNAGEYCLYNNVLYKATVQTTAEPGTNSDWAQCVVCNEIETLNQFQDTQYTQIQTDYGDVDIYKCGKVVYIYANVGNLPNDSTELTLCTLPSDIAPNYNYALGTLSQRTVPYTQNGSVWVYLSGRIVLYYNASTFGGYLNACYVIK